MSRSGESGKLQAVAERRRKRDWDASRLPSVLRNFASELFLSRKKKNTLPAVFLLSRLDINLLLRSFSMPSKRLDWDVPFRVPSTATLRKSPSGDTHVT